MQPFAKYVESSSRDTNTKDVKVQGSMILHLNSCKLMPAMFCLPMCVSTLAKDYAENCVALAQCTSRSCSADKRMCATQLHELSESEWLLQDKENRVLYGAVSLSEGQAGQTQTSVQWLFLDHHEAQGGQRPSEMAAAFQSEIEFQGLQNGTCFLQTPATFFAHIERAFSTIDLSSAAAGFMPIGLDGNIRVLGHVREIALQKQLMQTLTLPGARTLVSMRLMGSGDVAVPTFEIVDAPTQSVSHVPFSNDETEGAARRVIAACTVGQSDIVTVTTDQEETGATATLWRFDQPRLVRELGQWRQERGIASKDGALRLTKSWDKDKKIPESKGPRHGKAPDGKRHAGGNTWQGGTGGTDTAGLGGRGGPYRLDLEDGNQVMQMSDEQKADISEEARRAAQEMGQEELRKKLEAIHMTPYESQLYERFYGPVAAEVEQVRFHEAPLLASPSASTHLIM